MSENQYIFSGNPEEIEEKFACMGLKEEKRDEERDYSLYSEAYYERKLYYLLEDRTELLKKMEDGDIDKLIQYSKAFTKNLNIIHRTQAILESTFNVFPDPSDRNQYQIASKGWFNLLLQQQDQHYLILRQALGQHDSTIHKIHPVSIYERMNVSSEEQLKILKLRRQHFP